MAYRNLKSVYATVYYKPHLTIVLIIDDRVYCLPYHIHDYEPKLFKLYYHQQKKFQ